VLDSMILVLNFFCLDLGILFFEIFLDMLIFCLLFHGRVIFFSSIFLEYVNYFYFSSICYDIIRLD